MEVNELALAHPKLAGYQIGNDYWVFAAQDFKPSYWLVLKREGFSGDLFQASDELDQVTWELDDYEQLANIYRLEDTPPPNAWYKWDDWLRTDLDEFILAGRIQVYKVDEHVAQQLSQHNHPIYSNPDTSETEGTPSVVIRNQLAETLGKDVMDRWIGKDKADQLHWDRSALSRELSEIGDVGIAVYDVGKDLVVGLKDIGTFVITAVKDTVTGGIELAFDIAIAQAAFTRKLLNGDFDAIKDDLAELGVMTEKAIKESFKNAKAFAAKVEEGRKILWNITTDADSRGLLYDYLDSVYQSIKYEDSRVIGVKIVSVIGIEVLLALATAGAGNVARRVGQAAAKGAKAVKSAAKISRIGPFPIKAIDEIADLGRALDKPAVKTPEAPKLSIIPESTVKKKPAGLHNQDMDVEVKRGSFKTQRQVDMDNLSETDDIAKDAMLDQGWDDDKATEVLSSGNNFRTKELKAGDKLYGFDTQGRSKDINTSAYWTDEAGMNSIKQQHYKDGVWDKEGVKNTLALPCYNRANSISTVEVTQNTTAVQSTVGKATELIKYSDGSGYNTGVLGKIMPGGGTQTTVDPSVLKLLGN